MKKEVVLHQKKLQPCELDGSHENDFITFCTGREAEEDVPLLAINIPLETFDDLGAPMFITVCIRPGERTPCR